ncbi:anti-CBASS protein Acb1 family protein, partial [Haemophilus influenzae]
NQDGYAEALGINHFARNSANSTALFDLTLYELGGLAARVVDMPADAAISRSIEIQGDQDDAISNEIERLKILPALADMVRWSRFFGGAVMVLLTDDGARLSEPLEPSRITRIDEVRVFDLSQISPTANRYSDPTKPNYGRYSSYRLNIGTIAGSLDSQVEIHESRLLFMGGDSLPERLKNGLHWIGRSAVRSVYPKIRDYQKSLMWASLILERKQQAVHKMKGLA